MAETRSIRGFLRKHRKHRDELSEPRASASATSSCASYSGDVAMEGPLKKRVAKMPVMHDRYCVATWELDAAERKCAMLRSYKSRKAYDAHPERPSSVHELKCLSDWDGKTGFHRYQHAFTMETRDQKLFQCVAPSAADKDKWLELLAVQSAFRSGRDMRLNSVGSLVPLRRTQSVESAAETAAAVRKTSADSDGLFRTNSGASSNSQELPNGDKNEPADWGLYGGENKATYELQDDARPVLLDSELLDAKTLATDAYLFEEGRASRFGTVVVQPAAASDEDDDADFVDEQFAAREAQKQQQQSMRRRAQKLESNRDLYAEMAAARLAGMRKDARHPRKSLTHSRPSDESDSEEEQDEDELMVEGETKESVVELEDATQRHSSSRRSSKSRRKSFVSSSENANSVKDGYISGDDEEEEEVVVAPVEVAEAELDEEEELRQLKKQHRAERRAKKRLMKEREEEDLAALQAAELARAHREEQRAREEAKVREEQEKRDKKERREMKEKLKREKAKQRQAEAELRKLVELKQAEEERRERERKEKKDKKERKKAKKKEKYTSPAERIQKKEERAAERAAESAAAERAAESAAAAAAEPVVSNALVVVEKTAEPEPAPQPSAALEAAPTPAPTSSSSFAQTEVTPTVQVSAPVSVPVPPVAAPAPAGAPVGVPAAAPAQTMPMPMYQVAPPPFVPMYPPGPQGMPAYGLAATFGAYPPQLYPTPYGYGAPVGPQPTYMRPNMGFMAGLSAMGSFGKTTGPEPAPSSQDYAEPMIGPQLPTAEDRAAVSSAGASAAPPPPLSADKTSAKLTNLPELPDVVEF
ncbi:hypothetical protein PRIC2_014752 [Phytophthora ramorum]